VELSTTSAGIYLRNLDGQIAELTRLTAARPDLLLNLQKLSGSHYTRGRYRGDLDEIALAVEEAGECMKRAPKEGGCALMRAEEEQSLHRFAEARRDVATAKELGAPAERVASLQTELDWNDGVYAPAIDAIRRARVGHPSTATWMREAQLDHDLGLDDESDAAFERAEDMIVDTAPFPVAHLNLQRGIQKSQRGLYEDAVVFFREATLRMPTYVAAEEHLAETLHWLGRDEEATAIYERVVAQSSDPEFSHALASLYAARGRAAEAKALEAKAKAGYADLLERYPEAMVWHASEYYFAVGEKQKALDLLAKNVALRPNSASYVALARAQVLTGRAALARAAIDKALAMPVVSALLFATAAATYRAAGDAPRAQAFRERAEKLNPRIASDDVAKVW
jgi:tetratricopeptide (TPR) repeat protein